MNAAWLALGLLATAPPPDLLLYGGRILRVAETVTDSGRAPARYAEAVLIHGGRFAAVGTLAEVEADARKLHLAPRRVDLAGAFALPGLTDAHGHVSGLGFALERLRFEGMTSAKQIAGMVADTARVRPRGNWILGRGWDQNDWDVKEFPTHEILDHAAPDHPVWLRRVDGHAAWANARALALAGVTAATPDPPGGRIVRLPDGSPSGILVDNATALVERAIPVATAEQTRAAILRAAAECARFGLTAVHDPGIDRQTLAIYRELAGSGRLPIRVRAMLSAEEVRSARDLPNPKPEAGGGQFRLFAVKAYADGALGSRGAALLAPYSDDSANVGLLRTRAGALDTLARICLRAGYPLCTHAIGDRGNRVTLDAYERAAGGEAGLRGRRFRIEHAQVIAPEDLPRFARLGVIASMQPTHCTSDMPWAPTRLGPDRVKGAYAWRQLLSSGARLCFGSDFPVESPDPLLGIYAAVTTQDMEGMPPGGYRPSERLTVQEAIHGFTDWAAYAAFEEDPLGRIEPGWLADVSVFDRDLIEVPARDILSAHCVMTIVGGRVVYADSTASGKAAPGR